MLFSFTPWNHEFINYLDTMTSHRAGWRWVYSFMLQPWERRWLYCMKKHPKEGNT